MPTHAVWAKRDVAVAEAVAVAGCDARHDLITVYTCCCGWRAGRGEFSRGW